MRWIWISASVLLLCGCVPLQQKLKQEHADQAKYNLESHERAAADRCSQAATPGTTQHMECRLQLENTAVPSAK